MIMKSALRASLSEVLVEELEGTLSRKAQGELVEVLVDRIQVDFDVVDDESEGDEPEEEFIED